MKAIKGFVFAMVLAMLGACAAPAKPGPYAIALFAFKDGEVVAAQLQPAGDTRDACEKIGQGAQKRAASQGVSLGYSCLRIPRGAVVKAVDGAGTVGVRPRTSESGALKDPAGSCDLPWAHCWKTA